MFQKYFCRILCVFAVTLPLATTAQEAANLKPGLIGEFFDYTSGEEPLYPLLSLPEKLDQTPMFVQVDKKIQHKENRGRFGQGGFRQDFVVRWSGHLRIATAGEIQFFTTSDDGSRLYINDKLIVDNSGLHTRREARGKVTLTAADHPIRLEYFHSGGDAMCTLEWQPAGGERAVIPTSALFHSAARKAALKFTGIPEGKDEKRRFRGRGNIPPH